MLQSCSQKEGCTDPFAINYYETVTVDDGSCSYSSSRMVGDFMYEQDSTEHQAYVSKEGISTIKVFPTSAGTFDEDITEFFMIINWENKSMVMPDSLSPDDTFIDGLIQDIDNFTINMTYDPDSTHMDTSYTYTFTRL